MIEWNNEHDRQLSVNNRNIICPSVDFLAIECMIVGAETRRRWQKEMSKYSNDNWKATRIAKYMSVVGVSVNWGR